MGEKVKDGVLFIHIPKTAGTTFYGIARSQFVGSDVFKIIKEDIICKKNGQIAVKANITKSINNDVGQLHFIGGHIFFPTQNLISGQWKRIVFLRNPAERIISMYFGILRSKKHYMYDIITKKNISLKDFIQQRLLSEAENGQVRRLCGIYNEIEAFVDFPEITVNDYEEAKKNLMNRFAVIGITERFDESLLLLKKSMGWRNICYTQKRVGGNKPQKIHSDTMKLIEDYNKFDIKLYEFALEHFESLLKRYSITNNDLTQFKIKNYMYSRIYQRIKKRIVANS